jgi:hypothetical protein
MKPGPYNRKHSRGVESPPVHSSSYKDDTYNVQAPRVGGWTPEEAREVEWDKELRKGINERGEGEGRDGWFVIKSDLFPYQLQNKKWCEDTLRRLVAEANVSISLFPISFLFSPALCLFSAELTTFLRWVYRRTRPTR